jgi:hypothetical protein
VEIAAVGRRRRAGGRLDLGPASIAAVGRRGRAGGRLGARFDRRRGPALRAGGRLDLGPASIAAVGRRRRAGGRLGPASGSRRGPAGAGRRTTRARFWQPYGLSFVFYSFKSDLNLFRACMFTDCDPKAAQGMESGGIH